MSSRLSYSSVICNRDRKNHAEISTEARPLMYTTKRGIDPSIKECHLNASPHTALAAEYR